MRCRLSPWCTPALRISQHQHLVAGLLPHLWMLGVLCCCVLRRCAAQSSSMRFVAKLLRGASCEL